MIIRFPSIASICTAEPTDVNSFRLFKGHAQDLNRRPYVQHLRLKHHPLQGTPLYLRQCVLSTQAVEVPADESVNSSFSHSPGSPSPLHHASLARPGNAQTLVVSAGVTHQLFHQTEVNHIANVWDGYRALSNVSGQDHLHNASQL